MKVLITGADGFLGKNLRLHLAEREDVQLLRFTRGDDVAGLPVLLRDVDFIFHLAGVNRPPDPHAFVAGNAELTQALCRAVGEVAETTGRPVPIVYTSSTQAAQDSPYGRSKRAAEDALRALAERHGVPVHVFRLPNVFGKWSRPDYNSVVATFCHRLARGMTIKVHDPFAPITLVYVDDLMSRFVQLMDGAPAVPDAEGFATVAPQYASTVGELARQIHAFRDGRATLTTERVGTGLTRALYATYLSHLPTALFAYPIAQHRDPRGVFVEMLKTPDAGQFSFFTAHSGVTRGGHYHHSKTEKFLVIKGQALFRFRHMQTGEAHERITTGDASEIVETVPGWTHDITNIGTGELIVMLWANEVFDRSRPDTFACAL
jgi:UDP-2-acetamido-2,6-beta-L-arabino-hexul-4-ose reductase